MPLLTVEELRQHIETALEDEALQRILDDAHAALAKWAGDLVLDDYGDPEPVTETRRPNDPRLLELSMVPASVDTVDDYHGTTPTEVDAEDFVLERRFLRRIAGWWGDRVTVTYTPENDAPTRRMCLIGLSELEVNFRPGMRAQGAGPWSEAYADYQAQRVARLSTVRPATPGM